MVDIDFNSVFNSMTEGSLWAYCMPTIYGGIDFNSVFNSMTEGSLWAYCMPTI
jgi:hypothetical protein